MRLAVYQNDVSINELFGGIANRDFVSDIRSDPTMLVPSDPVSEVDECDWTWTKSDPGGPPKAFRRRS